MAKHELIKIDFLQIGKVQTNAVNARDLHEFLEVKAAFTDWIRLQIERALLEEHKDYEILLHEDMKQDWGGHNKIEYALTLEAAKNIGMISGTEKGKEVRAYFIECEKELLKPKSVIEMLENAVAELKAKEKRIQTLATKVEQDKPKVDFYEEVGKSDGCIETNELAKLLGVGPNAFLAWLRGAGYLMRRRNGYEPYQKYMEQGLFRTIEEPYPLGIYIKSIITPKGQQVLTKAYFTQDEEKGLPEKVRRPIL